MKTPFTAGQFLDTIKNYNLAVFPMQMVLYAVSISALYLAIIPTAKSDKMIGGILAFFWLWMGLVYHFIFFTPINKAAYVFGVMFMLQGILFLSFGIFKNKFSFRLSTNIYGITGIIAILYAWIIYPVLGYTFGHIYPYSPTFGLPCPTSIFTFGLLLLNEKKCPISILIIPFLWSIIGFTASFKFGIIEDTGLLVSGLIASSLLLLRNRHLSQQLMNPDNAYAK